MNPIFSSPDFANSTVTGALIYGPPESRRLRLLNRIRRLFGRDEQDEVFAYLAPDGGGDLTVGWSAGGGFELYGPFPPSAGASSPGQSGAGPSGRG